MQLYLHLTTICVPQQGESQTHYSASEFTALAQLVLSRLSHAFRGTFVIDMRIDLVYIEITLVSQAALWGSNTLGSGLDKLYAIT